MSSTMSYIGSSDHDTIEELTKPVHTAFAVGSEAEANTIINTSHSPKVNDDDDRIYVTLNGGGVANLLDFFFGGKSVGPQ